MVFEDSGLTDGRWWRPFCAQAFVWEAHTCIALSPSAPCQSAVCLQPPFCWWEGGAGALLMLFALQRFLPIHSCLFHAQWVTRVCLDARFFAYAPRRVFFFGFFCRWSAARFRHALLRYSLWAHVCLVFGWGLRVWSSAGVSGFFSADVPLAMGGSPMPTRASFFF